MLIGAMNHPQHDPVEEIRKFAEMGMQFVDLTLEPPAAASWRVDARALRAVLQDHGLGVVGHTPYYLPLGSPIDGLRQAAVEELRRCLQVFSEVGAKWMNIHPDRYAPMHDRAFYIGKNIESLTDLLGTARDLGVGLMLENLPGDYNTPEQIGELLDPLPEVGLHLDVGHANLMVPENTTEPLLDRFGKRLRHVHLHDNKGGHNDQHLPLGAGTLDVARYVGAIRRCGYDGTITLEVFTPDPHFLLYSRDRLRELWDAA